MEITLKIEEKNQKFVGYIEKNNNKFFVKIEVPHGMTLPDVIVNIQGFYEGIGTITMMNNKNIVFMNIVTIKIFQFILTNRIMLYAAMLMKKNC